MGQFSVVADPLVDLTAHGAAQLQSRWPAWKWEAGVGSGGQIVGLGTDVGGMAMCYRRDLFARAGLPTERDEVAKLWPTWEAYISTGTQFRSRMGDKVAFTDGMTSGTVRVWWAIARTPTTTEPRVKCTCRRWRITQNRATAVTPMISVAITSVAHATSGMAVPFSRYFAGSSWATLPA